ncbi:MAG: DUF1292 domain-containing protein [Clostridiales bacterium]|nr:DUF1292 domain-containing protein [Clostridiales bacterium]
MSEEYTPDLVTIVDEDEQEHTFEILDRIETDDSKYVAVVPYYESVDELLEDDGEVFVLRVIEEGDETFLEAIEDDQELEDISSIFEERLSDYLYEDEDDEEE